MAKRFVLKHSAGSDAGPLTATNFGSTILTADALPNKNMKVHKRVAREHVECASAFVGMQGFARSNFGLMYTSFLALLHHRPHHKLRFMCTENVQAFTCACVHVCQVTWQTTRHEMGVLRILAPVFVWNTTKQLKAGDIIRLL